MRKAILTVMLMSTVAFADGKTPAPPTKMALSDAKRIDEVFGHRQLIIAKYQAMAAVETYDLDREIKRICKQYGIDPAQLTVSVGINPETGEIQRKDPNKK